MLTYVASLRVKVYFELWYPSVACKDKSRFRRTAVEVFLQEHDIIHPTQYQSTAYAKNSKGKNRHHLPFSPFPLKPLLAIIPPIPIRAPKLDQPLGPQDIAAPQQRRHVDVQGAVRVGAAEQHADGAQALEDAVRRRPGVLEEVEADLARVERDVGVHDLRDKGDFRGVEGVGLREGDCKEPASFYEGEGMLAIYSCSKVGRERERGEEAYHHIRIQRPVR